MSHIPFYLVTSILRVEFRPVDSSHTVNNTNPFFDLCLIMYFYVTFSTVFPNRNNHSHQVFLKELLHPINDLKEPRFPETEFLPPRSKQDTPKLRVEKFYESERSEVKEKDNLSQLLLRNECPHNIPNLINYTPFVNLITEYVLFTNYL